MSSLGDHDRAIADFAQAMTIDPHLGQLRLAEAFCQPESPLAWIYREKRQYDKSWDVVNRAKASRRWIAPEVLEQLKAASRSTITSS